MLKTSRKILYVFVFIVAFALTSTACLYGTAADTIQKSFPVKPGGQLVLETDLGSIEINTSNTNTLEIDVTREARIGSTKRAEEILEDFELSFRQDGNTVYVNGDYKQSGLSRFWNNIGKHVRIHFLISLPREFNIDLKTSGGKISVDDLKGEARAKTSGGSLSFSRIQGPVWGRTSGGSISLISCTSKADVRTSGGSITLGEVSGEVFAHTSGGGIKVERSTGDVDVSTSGGSIHVNEAMGVIKAETSGGSITAYITRQPRSDCRLSTSGGSVTVYLPEGVGVNVNAETSGGRVYTEFPVTIKGELNKRSLNAKINNGGPELYLHTSGGSIYIKKQISL